MTSTSSPSVRGLATVLAVELSKLRRSLALLLSVVAPLLIAVFLFFNMFRLEEPISWTMTFKSAAGIWAFFMLPMSVTALTVLIAHIEHGNRSWDHLRALPLQRWHLFAAKLLCILGLLLFMSALLAFLTVLAVTVGGWMRPEAAATGSFDIAAYFLLLGRIFLAAWLLVSVQLWIALRFSSFVPALATGIGGTFFAVVGTSAKIGAVLPWQIPVNQLATNPERAQLTLIVGVVGGAIGFLAMLWSMSRHEMLG